MYHAPRSALLLTDLQTHQTPGGSGPSRRALLRYIIFVGGYVVGFVLTAIGLSWSWTVYHSIPTVLVCVLQAVGGLILGHTLARTFCKSGTSPGKSATRTPERPRASV